MPRTLEFKGSSNLKAATLNDDGTFEVTFASGSKATYRGMTAEVFAEWEASQSAGRFFHQRIRSKPADYPMIAGGKDAEAAAALPEPPPPPASTPPQRDELGEALKREAALKQQLAEANARADKAELERSRLSSELAARPSAEKSTDFRPWRRRRTS